MRKNNAAVTAGSNTAISVGRRSGGSSMADAQAINIGNTGRVGAGGVEDEAFSPPMAPHSAAESVADMSAQRRPNSKKQQEFEQYTKNAGT